MISAIYCNTKFDIFCIGTPRIVGDSVGPLIGTMLDGNTYGHDVKIIGTMDNPVTRLNYRRKLQEIRDGSYVIAIDAALGPRVGEWIVKDAPLQPGTGIGATNMTPVGDTSIKCYIGRTLRELVEASHHAVEAMATDVSTGLTYLLNGTKKKVYI